MKLYYYSDTAPDLNPELTGPNLKEENQSVFESQLMNVKKMPNLIDLNIFFLLQDADSDSDSNSDISDDGNEIDEKYRQVLTQNFQTYFSFKCPLLKGFIQINHGDGSNSSFQIFSRRRTIRK